MANQRSRRQTRQYHQNGSTYRVIGSAAYQPEYDGPAVRVRRPHPEVRPQVQPRRQPTPRPRVQVRPAGTVSLLAVVGFAAVAVCAVLLLIANARLMVLNDETVRLRTQLDSLQTEEATLLARRDKALDLDAIESELVASGTMVQPQPSQITYINADQPDSVVKYERPRLSFREALFEKLQAFSGGQGS